VGAVFKYAANAGLATKNIAAEINRRHDLPETTEAEQRYLTHPQLLDLAKETARFEILTLVLGYCGCRFGEAAALRRKDVSDREITVRASPTYVAGQGIVETDNETKRSRRVPVPEPVWERLRGELPVPES
jgi:integrase